MTSTSPASPLPLSVFISYSHKDEDLREELDTHLANLKRQGKIQAWHDRAIEAGTEWDAQIKHHLETAEVILLLISPRFMASDYCYDLEMQGAIARHNAGTARVIPIILKPVDWQGSPFSKLQALPIAHGGGAKPITQWANQDEAFFEVVKGIRGAVESLQAKKSRGAITANAPAILPPPTAALTASESLASEPAASTTPAAMTAFQRQRLETQQAGLQQTWTDKMAQLTHLRQALAIESSAGSKFQLQRQVQTAEAELAQLERQLEKIEQDLTNSDPPKK